MNISRESVGNLCEKIAIQLVPEDYMPEVEKQLKKLKQQANIPGFRKGFAPMGMIERMYGESIVLDTINNKVNQELDKYIADNDIEMFFDPIPLEEIIYDRAVKNQVYNFCFEIGVHPKFEIDYEEIKGVVYHNIVASEEEIDDEVKKLCRKMGRFVSTETVADDDMLLVNVTPDNGGENFTSTLIVNYIKKEYLPEFIGKNINEEFEVDTTVVFKGDQERATFLKINPKKLADAPEKIRLKIEAIHHIEPAELNEPFFEMISSEDLKISDETTLRKFFAEHISQGYLLHAHAFYQKKVFNVILEKTHIELPDEFLKKYLVTYKSKEGYTSENIEKEYPELTPPVYKQLIGKQIAKDLDITVSNEELKSYFINYVSQHTFGKPYPENEEEERIVGETLRELQKSGKNIQSAYQSIQSEKITKYLLDKLNPPQQDVTFDDFLNLLNKFEETPVEEKTKEKTNTKSKSQSSQLEIFE